MQIISLLKRHNKLKNNVLNIKNKPFHRFTSGIFRKLDRKKEQHYCTSKLGDISKPQTTLYFIKNGQREQSTPKDFSLLCSLTV